ncbi:MAG: ribokinase [Anaerolineales bacterium]|nr:ribokinase [Anaerolineales bacterium]
MTDIPKYDVLVIGSLNADLVVRSPRFPGPGETISGEDLQIIPGGKGANQAVAASRQGSNVAMVGRVGSDSFGPFLVDNLKTNQVDTAHVLPDHSATGTAIIVVDSNGQNSIVLSPGANAQVNKTDVDSAPDAKILLLQFEIPMDIVLHAAKRYKTMGTTVILNPAPARNVPEELLTLIDILVPNETELGLLTNKKVTDAQSAESAAKELLQRGVKTVIVTLGANGALLVTKEKSIQVPSFKVNVVDTTAAGDSFIGGFASKLLESNSLQFDELQNAVRYGCACGALATTKFGAQPSLPTKKETEALLNS